MSKRQKNNPNYGGGNGAALQQEVEQLRTELRSKSLALEVKDKRISELQTYGELAELLEQERKELAVARKKVEDEIRADEARIREEWVAEQTLHLTNLRVSAEQDAQKLQEEAELGAQQIVDQAKVESEKIKAEADQQVEQMKADAQKLIEQATDEKATILQQAETERKESLSSLLQEFEQKCSARVANLERRESEVATREKSVKLEQFHLKDDCEDLEFDRSELKLRADSLLRRWEQCSPERISQAERSLAEARNLLSLNEQAFTEQLQEINRLRALIPSSQGHSAESLLRDLNTSQRRCRELEDRLASYPSIEELAALRKESETLAQLRKDFHELSRHCSDLEMRALQNELGRREMEQLKVEAEALRVLNDELRTELQSHKEALEQKTGERFPELGRLDRTHKVRAQELEPFPNVSNLLQRVAKHIRTYAASRSPRLYYSDSAVRSFLAGMASSRLAILQGLSGTGKTSLPRVFIEAIGGQCRIVPVQSSWRDRHELLGYNNDFNKRFSETEFTKAVYESGFPDQEDAIWAIVLDEMNLARIEYYFADFLSVLEQPDHDKWFVSLMDHNPFTQTDAGPKYLDDGHKLRIPRNLWFIGTANQDESTFEITDKVYDRSQVIDFRTRQREFEPEENLVARYLSLSRLEKAFRDAIQNPQYRLLNDDWNYISRIDEFLRDKLDLSFGNRIKMQMEVFVPVFIACGGRKEEAVDLQIARKVLRKLGNRFEAGLGDVLKQLQDVLQDRPSGWNELRHSLEILRRKIDRTLEVSS